MEHFVEKELTLDALLPFIGCQVTCEILHPGAEYTFLGVDWTIYTCIRLSSVESDTVTHGVQPTDIKPLLTPLIRISDEDERVIFNYDQIISSLNQILKDMEGGEYHHPHYSTVKSVEQAITWEMTKRTMYLISKEYDVHRWIDKGLAEDKAKKIN